MQRQNQGVSYPPDKRKPTIRNELQEFDNNVEPRATGAAIDGDASSGCTPQPAAEVKERQFFKFDTEVFQKSHALSNVGLPLGMGLHPNFVFQAAFKPKSAALGCHKLSSSVTQV